MGPGAVDVPLRGCRSARAVIATDRTQEKHLIGLTALDTERVRGRPGDATGSDTTRARPSGGLTCNARLSEDPGAVCPGRYQAGNQGHDGLPVPRQNKSAPGLSRHRRREANRPEAAFDLLSV